MNVLPFEGDDDVDSDQSNQCQHIEHTELRKITEKAIIANFNEKKARMRVKGKREQKNLALAQLMTS